MSKVYVGCFYPMTHIASGSGIVSSWIIAHSSWLDRINDLVTHDWKQMRLVAVIGLTTSPWT